MKAIAHFVLRMGGWKCVRTVEIPAKCVICVAPHTSNLDFFIGKMFYTVVGDEKPYFLIKKEWFFFPLGYLVRWMGGISVDRKKNKLLSDQLIEEFAKRDRFQLAVTPEGTRKKNAKWKTGFYRIAMGAKVPILLAHIDFDLKEIGICKIIHPRGNFEEELEEIKQYYKHFKGKHPDNFAI